MKENNYKPRISDVMEAIFDAAYLIFDLIAAMLFFIFSQGKSLFINDSKDLCIYVDHSNGTTAVILNAGMVKKHRHPTLYTL